MLEPEKKSNALLGSGGALLGALVGVGICGIGAVILSHCTFAIGAIIGLLATIGYLKLGGCFDVKGLAISAVIVAIATFVGIQLVWVLSIYRQYMDAIGGASIPGIYESFFDILRICNVTTRFFANLLGGYLGAMGVLFGMHAKSNKKKNAEPDQTNTYNQ